MGTSRLSSVVLLSEAFTSLFYERRWKGCETLDVRSLSLAEAYQVQEGVATRRIARGGRIAGYKVGCTSSAIQSQFGLTEPIHGRLYRPYIYSDSVTLSRRNYVNCAIEPEMVLTIGKDLRTSDLTDRALLDAIESIRPGIELHHYRFWHPPASSQELICSGGLHAGLIIGDQAVNPQAIDLLTALFSVYKNDVLAAQAPASEIMGGPLISLRWLVNSLVQQGTYLPAGSLVIPGSPTELVVIDEDVTLRVDIEGVGQVTGEFIG